MIDRLKALFSSLYSAITEIYILIIGFDKFFSIKLVLNLSLN